MHRQRRRRLSRLRRQGRRQFIAPTGSLTCRSRISFRRSPPSLCARRAPRARGGDRPGRIGGSRRAARSGRPGRAVPGFCQWAAARRACRLARLAASPGAGNPRGGAQCPGDRSRRRPVAGPALARRRRRAAERDRGRHQRPGLTGRYPVRRTGARDPGLGDARARGARRRGPARAGVAASRRFVVGFARISARRGQRAGRCRGHWRVARRGRPAGDGRSGIGRERGRQNRDPGPGRYAPEGPASRRRGLRRHHPHPSRRPMGGNRRAPSGSTPPVARPAFSPCSPAARCAVSRIAAIPAGASPATPRRSRSGRSADPSTRSLPAPACWRPAISTRIGKSRRHSRRFCRSSPSGAKSTTPTGGSRCWSACRSGSAARSPISSARPPARRCFAGPRGVRCGRRAPARAGRSRPGRRGCRRGSPKRRHEHGIALIRVEDGFVRSVGLGSDFVPAASLVLDAGGMHYDPDGAQRPRALAAGGRFRCRTDRARRPS